MRKKRESELTAKWIPSELQEEEYGKRKSKEYPKKLPIAARCNRRQFEGKSLSWELRDQARRWTRVEKEMGDKQVKKCKQRFSEETSSPKVDQK